jgi:hypothetical protein
VGCGLGLVVEHSVRGRFALHRLEQVLEAVGADRHVADLLLNPVLAKYQSAKLGASLLPRIATTAL